MKIAGYILAGGKNSRMQGRKKAFMTYRGKMFLDHIIHALEPLSSFYISVDSVAAYQHTGYRLVEDKYKETGPLGGICSGLETCHEEALYVISCDTPCITKEVVQEMVRAYHRSGKMVLAADAQRLHPLIGIYTKESLPVMQKMIQKRDYRMMSLLDQISYDRIVFRNCDNVFQNINSPEDYRDISGE